jgi:O-antigen/teichoic acid export membrane protein
MAAVGVWFVYEHWFSSPDREIADAALLLVVLSLVVLQMTLLNIAYRSLGRYAEGTFLLDLVIPVEAAVVLAVPLLGGGFVETAGALLLVRILSFGIYYLRLRRLAPWLSLGWTHASASEIRALAQPALGAMALPLSNALNIQGVVFIVGLALSPTVAAMFGTARTISRVPIQVVGMLTRASLPEITIAHTRSDQGKLNRLVASNILAVLLVSVPAAIAIVLFGPAVLSLLSRGRLSGSIALFVLLVVVMALQTLWNTVGGFLVSLNLQHRFAYVYIAVSAVACAAICFTARYLGVDSVLVLMIAVDAIMTVVVIRRWNEVSGARWREYLRAAHGLPGLLGRMSGFVRRRA